MLILFLTMILLNIYFINFIKFLMISEVLMSIFVLFFSFFNLNMFSIILIFISIMIIESSLGIFILFEFFSIKKNLFSNNNMNY